MAVISERQINEQIKKGNISQIYFIYGEDHFLIKNIVEKIVDVTVTSCPEFNYNNFKLGANVQDIYDCVEMMPLMSDRKCVTVCDFNFDKCLVTEFNKMIELLEQPNESTVLVFWFETVVPIDKKKSDRIKSVLKQIEKHNGVICKVGHRENSELVAILKKAAEKRGCKLNSSVAHYMIETCGSDMFTLKNEIEKICYYSENGEITNELVNKICSKTIEASIFNLSKMIISKNIKGALVCLDELLFMNVGFGTILYNLSSAFMDLSRAKAAMDCGIKPISLAEDFNYSSNVTFRLTNAERSVRYLSNKQVKSLLKKILDCEKALKSVSSNEKVAMDQLIVDLIVTLQKGE